MVAKSKKFLFYLIAFAIPVLFFVGIEYGLRKADYGETYPLFLTDKGLPGYYFTSSNTIQRYFPKTGEKPIEVSIETQIFNQQKPKDGYRVFVQGGSSAAGFPYGLSGSITMLLDQRLKRTFPGKPIEVITTAMSAVNSYTLLDYVDEIIAQQPDAVVIYAGHNEYVGVMGVGSMFSSEFSRPVNLLMLKFKDLHLVQWLRNHLALWMQPEKDEMEEEQPKRGTVMARAARGQEIPYQSEVYQQGIEQFHGNMALILQKYQQAGIKVLISTIGSNEKDLKPFKSGLSNKTDVAKWQQLYNAVNIAFTAQQWDLALQKVQQLIALDDVSADAYYMQGLILQAQQQYEAARDSFVAAKDRDQLRFRAPEAMNQVIRELAQQYGAVLVDGQQKLRQNSPHGIIGNELILEHLHPNLKGYFLLAEAFYDTFKQQNLISDWNGHYVDAKTAWQEMPITGIDLRLAQYKISNLLSDYPFTDTPKQVQLPAPKDRAEELGQMLVERKATWMPLHQKLLSEYIQQRNLPEATRVAVMLADALPVKEEYNYTAANLLIQSKRHLQAVPYLQKILRQNPQNLNANLAMADVSMAQKQFAAAKGYLEQALAIKPEQPQVKGYLAKLQQMGY